MKKVTLAISLFLISMFYVFFVNAYAEGANTKTKAVTPEKLEFDIAIETATQQYTTGTITTEDGLIFDTSTGTITGCTSESAISIIIPNQINGITVKAIGDNAFNYYYNLIQITIPDSVTYIGDEAFFSCVSLTQITIPDSVTYIGSYAFYNCSNLTKVNIPNNITSIRNRTFCYCNNLTQITIPENVTYIGSHAFYDCSSLIEITIPENVDYIGDEAFSSCSSLTQVTFLSKSSIYMETNHFGSRPFRQCSSLKSVYCFKNSNVDSDYYYPNSNVKFYYLDETSNIDFKVKDTEGRAGEEVDVYVSVDNNSGLAVYDLKVNFDKTKVTPVSITQINSDEISGGLVSNLRKPSVSAESLDFVTAVWSNASNVTYNGDLFKIRFKIKDDVLYSEVPITLEFNEDGLLDENYETLTPSITNGKITVYPPYEFGDINMDGKINARDLLMLTQYLAEYNNITFNASQLYLADVYKDGNIDLLDLLLLKQYLAGWDVVLGQTIAQNISLFSDDSISLDLNSEYISDDEIKVSVLAKDNPGIAAFKLKLNYDNTVLTPVSLTKGTAVTGSITTNINSLNENSNYVTALWSDIVNSNSDGVLYSVIFKVKDNSSGNTKLSLTCSEKDIINENFMNISSNQAEIEIKTDNQ